MFPVLLVIAAVVLFVLAGLQISARHFSPQYYAAACLTLAFFWAALVKAF